MCYTVLSRTTRRVVTNLTQVEEALIAEEAGFRVEAHGEFDVLELARARMEASPDYNSQPSPEEEWVKYTSKAGRLIVCRVIRLFAPDAEGYPQLAELVLPRQADTSFVAQASSCKVFDLGDLSPDLAAAIRDGELGDDNGEPTTPKMRHGLRRE